MNDNASFLLRAAGSLATLLLLLYLHRGAHAAAPQSAATVVASSLQR